MAYALHNAGTLETLPVSIERPTEILEVALALDASETARDIDEELLRNSLQTMKPRSANWWNVTSIAHSVLRFGFSAAARMRRTSSRTRC